MSRTAHSARREAEMEMKFVQQHKVKRPGEELHIIHAGWLQNWWNHIAHGQGPHPGPIPNWDLLDSTRYYQKAKRGITAGVEYKAVSRDVWNFLLTRYHGGPDIECRAGELNIYTATIRERGVYIPEDAKQEREEQQTIREREQERQALQRGNTTDSRDSTQSQSSQHWFRSSSKLSRALTTSLQSDAVLSNIIKERDDEDINSLSKESDFVKSHDVPAPGEDWHLIDALWLRRWRKYMNQTGPYPGPICNEDLLDARVNYQAAKEGLVAGRHYRGISETAWNFLQQRYGGGPDIVAPELDIYLAQVRAKVDESLPVSSRTSEEDDEQCSSGCGSKTSCSTAVSSSSVKHYSKSATFTRSTTFAKSTTFAFFSSLNSLLPPTLRSDKLSL